MYNRSYYFCFYVIGSNDRSKRGQDKIG